MGDHAIVCANHGERIARHNMLRDAIYQAASQAALRPAREEQALLPGSESRPADIFLPSFDKGRDCALDVTVVSPLQQALISKASEEPGAALTFAYDRKIRQSYDACHKEGISFLPLPIETLGGFHPTTTSTISKIARALATHSSKPASEVSSHLFQRLGILLTKGNSALVLSRAPSIPASVLDGDRDQDQINL